MQTSIASIRCAILNVSPKTNWTFVVVTASDGVCAWGEASLNAWEPMLRGAIELVANQAVGLTLEAATSALRVSTHSTGGPVHAAAISATLQALLELQAVNTGQDWASLLGPLRRAKLMAYANINRARPISKIRVKTCHIDKFLWWARLAARYRSGTTSVGTVGNA